MTFTLGNARIQAILIHADVEQLPTSEAAVCLHNGLIGKVTKCLAS